MLEISVEAHEELSKLLKANGFAHVDKFKIPEKEFSKWLHECEAQHPEESYEQHFLRVCYRYACHKLPAPKIEEPEHLTAREFRWWALALILLLVIALVRSAHAQIDVIQFQDNTGAVVKVFAAPFKFKAGSNCSAASAGSVLTFNCAGGAAAAGGLNTQVQYNNATALGGITNVTSDGTNLTKLTSTGTIDFSGSTIFKNRLSAGLTTSTNGDCGYDTTNNRWHCWQGGADRLMIASTNVGVSGQAFLSNADGSGVFADPIVSGPDAVGATPTKNPVQIGGLFLTTPATLTNNQVGAAQLDSVQNLLVHVNFALPTGSNVIGHVINDSGSTTAVTGNVTVINAGTFAVQAALNAETTKIIGETIPVATATTTDTTLRCILVSAASTNATNCKNAAGNVYGFRFFNTTTTVYYLRMYNASSSPTCSSATNFIESIPVPPAAAAGGTGGFVSMESFGEGYSTGISFCFTGGSSSTDNTNAAVGVFGTILYK